MHYVAFSRKPLRKPPNLYLSLHSQWVKDNILYSGALLLYYVGIVESDGSHADPEGGLLMDSLPPLDQCQLQSAVHEALSDWTRSGQTGADLSSQLLLVRETLAGMTGEQKEFAARQATYEVLEEALERLAEQDETGAKVLRFRFFDGEITRQVAARLHASPDQVNRWQRSAIENLTSFLMTSEMKRREELSRMVLEGLPAAPASSLRCGKVSSST